MSKPKTFKPKTLKLKRNGKDKIFMEVKFEENNIIGIGKPFKIFGACQITEEDVELVIETVKKE